MPYVNLRPNDQLLVVRGTNSYKTSVEALRTNSAVLQDNDQFLVQRGTNSYRISKLELQNEINTLPDDPPVVTSVVLAQDQFNANRFTGNSFTTTVTATNQPTQLKLRAEVVGALSESASTEPIDANTYNGSGGVPLELEGDANLGTKFKVGDVVQASATYTPTSSEITNVTQLSVEASDKLGVDWTPNINNPSYYTYGTNGADYYLYVKFNAAQTLKGNLRQRAGINAYQGGTILPGCTVNGVAVSVINDPNDNAYWIYSTDGLTVNAGEFVTIRLPVSAPGTPFFYGFDPGVFVVSGVEIECTDSTDLKLFQTGDVVGGGVGWGTELVYVNNSEGFDPSFPPVLAVDGDNDTYAGAKNKGVDTKMFIDLRRLTSGFGYQGEVSVFKAGSTGNYRWYCENTDGTVSSKTSSDGTVEWAVLNPGNTSKYVKTIIAESDEGYVTFIRGIALGSQASVLATQKEMGNEITGPVNVVSTKPSNNKITVDGGKWGGYNTSQDWSDAVGSTGGFLSGYGPENGFDGSLSTYVTAPNNTVILTFTPVTSIPYSDSVKIRVANYGNSASLNSGTAIDCDINTLVTLATGSGTLNNIQVNGSSTGSASWYEILVDDKVLVDGPWNQSQDWTQTIEGNWDPSHPAAQLFDGSLTTGAQANDANNASVEWNPITATQSIRVYGSNSGASANDWQMYVGNSWVNIPLTGSDPDWFDVPATFPASVGGIQNTAYKGRAYGIKIDGELLVSPGVGGDTQVSTVSPKRGSGTIKSISGTDVEIQPFTDNCFKETQTLIKTGPIKITPITEPIKTINGNTIEFDGPEQLLNFAGGDTVTMCNADGTPASVTYETSEIVGVDENIYVGPSNVSNDDYTSWLAGKNVTAITGFWVSNQGYDASYTAFFRQPTINGSPLPSFGLTATNIVGSPLDLDAQYSWEQWLDNSGSGVVQGENPPGFYSCKVASTPVSTFVCDIGNYSQDKLSAGIYDQNGEMVALIGTYNDGITLTFEDDTNLDKFPIGTVVGESSTVYSARCSTDGGSWWSDAYTPPNAFTGESTDSPYCGGLPYKWIKIDFRGLNQNCQGLEVRAVILAGLYIRINGSDTLIPSDQTTAGDLGAFFNTHDWSGVDGNDILDEIYFDPNTSNGNSFSWVKIGGVYLKDGTAYTVTDNSDIANDKLTVSGGEWGGFNTEEDWSSKLNATPAGGYPATAAFDGDPSTGCLSNAISTPVIYEGTLTGVTSLAIRVRPTSVGEVVGNTTFRISGNGIQTKIITDNEAIIEMPITVTDTTVSNIRVELTGGGSYSPGISTLRVNAKILVDGPWNQSEVWSEYGSAVGGFTSSNPLSNSFDGNVLTMCQSIDYDTVFTLSGFSIPFTDKVEVYQNMLGCLSSFNEGAQIEIGSKNGGGVGWKTVSNGAGNFESLELTSTDTAYVYFSAIRVDGVLLVNKGIGGETELSTSYSGVGTVSTVNATDNKIVLSNSNNQWIADYHMTTTEKNKVEMTGYLSFNSSGGDVQLSRTPKDFTLMTDVTTPTITFPATFSTGNAPDTDLPNPTYLKTYVQAGNVKGFSAEASSNSLYPITTSASNLPPPGGSRLMVEEFNEFCKMVGSCDYRSAEATIEEAVSQVSDLRERAEHVKTELEAN